MATNEEQDKTLSCLLLLKNLNNLNIYEIETHRDDFKKFLADRYPYTAQMLQDNSTTFDEFLFVAQQIDNGTPVKWVQWLTSGPFERYIDSLGNSRELTRSCVNSTMGKITQLFEQPLEESGEPRKIVSGLVVGKVQSGKTSNYVGLMVKAFAEGWNVVIVLTSNSDLLETQTAGRIQKDFEKKPTCVQHK